VYGNSVTVDGGIVYYLVSSRASQGNGAVSGKLVIINANSTVQTVYGGFSISIENVNENTVTIQFGFFA
jgi:hypothetical protein